MTRFTSLNEVDAWDEAVPWLRVAVELAAAGVGEAIAPGCANRPRSGVTSTASRHRSMVLAVGVKPTYGVLDL